MKYIGEVGVKSIFIHFLVSLSSDVLKCVFSNSTNRILKNELGQRHNEFQNRFSFLIGFLMVSKLKNVLLKNMRNVT
jgi:hypothetical protein